MKGKISARSVRASLQSSCGKTPLRERVYPNSRSAGIQVGGAEIHAAKKYDYESAKVFFVASHARRPRDFSMCPAIHWRLEGTDMQASTISSFCAIAKMSGIPARFSGPIVRKATLENGGADVAKQRRITRSNSKGAASVWNNLVYCAHDPLERAA